VSTPDEVLESHYGNILYKPMMDTLYHAAWAGNDEFTIGEVYCEPVNKDGTYFSVGPRFVARKQLKILLDMGYKLMSAFEIEGRINHADTQKPLFEGKDVFVQQVFAKHESLLLNMERYAAKAGIEIGHMHTEWGHGQYEWVMDPLWGIDTPDKMFAFKGAAREVCQNRGYECLFVSLPSSDATGNGLHFNHSLWDLAGNNVFHDEKCDRNFSQLGRYWVGGLLRHGRAMAALCAPTVNCYRRMHTAFCPDKVDWDFDNRDVLIRVKAAEEGSHSKGTYVENRYGSACCNPYIMLAVTVAAGIDGIKNKIEPPAPGDPKMMECNVPFSLTEALEALEEDKVLGEALGETFTRWFLQNKRELDLVELATSDATKMDEEALSKEREFYKYM
jgi:glutamine synthetase